MSRILVIDDQAASRDALAELLGDEGYGTAVAADAARALELLAAGGVDLVLLDVGLPKMSGLELLEHVRRTRSPVELPVIMVTAATESHAVVKALACGASDYVTKPVDFPVLLARVRTQLELCRLSRLKDEFLRIASHDLKNPLTTIQLSADGLLEDFPPGAAVTDEMARYVEAVARSATKMRMIIAGFLDLGALRDGKLVLELEPVDLRELVLRAIDGNSIYAHRKSIGLGLAPGPSPGLATGDDARLAQVLDNLVSNAIKFTPAGGTIELALSGDDAWVRLEVRDSGPGLAEGDFVHLFEPHGRASSRPTGGESSTGLGLALCLQLIELHRGRIGARNGEKRGAIFWFELPRAIDGRG